MDKRKKITGVVLAGGCSSRMGQNKALLDYNGKPLLDHMIALLKQTGLDDIYVSGDEEGYRCIPDNAPYKGPAMAIQYILAELDIYNGVLFVPVDMPLLRAEVLHLLMERKEGGYFTEFPLPAYIGPSRLTQGHKSVKELLAALKIDPVSLPSEFEACMVNTNTPEDWEEALRA